MLAASLDANDKSTLRGLVCSCSALHANLHAEQAHIRCGVGWERCTECLRRLKPSDKLVVSSCLEAEKCLAAWMSTTESGKRPRDGHSVRGSLSTYALRQEHGLAVDEWLPANPRRACRQLASKELHRCQSCASGYRPLYEIR